MFFLGRKFVARLLCALKPKKPVKTFKTEKHKNFYKNLGFQS